MAAPTSVYTKRYDKFAGVDFSTDAAKISDSRSPSAKNLISDSGGYPEKRVGWREEKNFDARINGIFSLDEKMIVHAGTSAYIYDGTESTLALSNLTDAKSFGIIFGDKLYILTGGEFLVFDGEELSHVHDKAFVPFAVTGMEPDDERYYFGGTSFQPFNLLTLKRKVGIKKPAELKEIRFDVSVVKDSVKLYRPNGEEYPEESYTVLYPGTEDRWSIMIKFNYNTSVNDAGDDFIIEYELRDEERLAKNRGMIEKCTFAAVYENRLFVGGNPDYPNVDFYCELNDASYFTDISYTGIGTMNESANEDEEKARENSGAGKILGYSYVGNYLAIHRDNTYGASVYLRSAQMTDAGMIFPIDEGFSGESILTHHTCGTFLDDPLILTKSGVYGIASADITGAHCMQSRSTRVNARLTAEENLSEAVACTHSGYYFIFINGNVYVADARQKTYARNTSNAYEYEWYFWDNIPARCVHATDDTIYFGTESGALCRFNNDLKSERGGYLARAYNDNGAPIVAEWSTRMDDDGDFGVLKSLRRRGSGVYIKSYPGACNVEIIVRTEHDFGERLNYAHHGIFSFESLDFENFTFNTHPFGFIAFTRKVKDYRMIQVTCRNAELNQPFGVYAIERRYAHGYFAK